MDNKEHKTADFTLDFGLDVSDDDDDVLAQACEDSDARLENTSGSKANSIFIGSRNEGSSNGGNSYPSYPSVPESTPLETLPGFDKEAGKTWVYPINYPVREYQYSIVEKALFRNTLVSLPTGLGKTFIAAVVMYNFYRWYPNGKVVFTAPTKPLVTQQITACFHIMGIPQEHTSEMTGLIHAEKRASEWCKRRVFFLTPEVLVRDLARGSCPAVLIKCLVIDEAHHALGNYAYCQAIHCLHQHRHDFRVVALSATPGTDVMAVKQVLKNLFISEIEIRNEDSTDIQPYTHQRKVEKVVVSLGNELKSLQTRYNNVLRVYVFKLIDMKVLYTRDETTLTKFQVLKARDSFRQSPPESLPPHKYGMVEGIFALCMTLYHSYELLKQHGTKAFYMFMKGTLDNDKGHRFARSELNHNQVFQSIMNELAQKFDSSVSKDTSNTPGPQDNSGNSRRQENLYPYIISHPKMEKLLDVVTKHHQEFADRGATTRIIIFSQYRDSVEEITGMLTHHHPLVKAMSFMGQSKGARSGRGFSQKEQLQVINSFRDGGYNTLVSTCVGLDIGEVDLIVCYDAPKSPVRLAQRMGRTGRQREGRIVILVTEGREEQMYNQSQYQKKSIINALMDKKRLENYLNPTSPRMVPRGMTPVCMKLHMKVGTWKTQAVRGRKKTSSSSNSITSFLTKSSSSTSKMKAVVKQSLMSREEWDWYRKNLKVPQEEVKNLPHPLLMCLSQHDKESGTIVDEHTINLGTYHPWQTTAQSTHTLGHTSRSETLVHLAEFTGLQQHLDPGDDPYGLEMASFLDMGYVSSHDKDNGCTLDQPSLFTTIKSKSTSHTSSLQHSEAGPSNKERKQYGTKGKVSKGRKRVHPIQSSLITHMLSQKSNPKMKKEKDGSDFPDGMQDFKDKCVSSVKKNRKVSDLSEKDEENIFDIYDQNIQETEKKCQVPVRIDSKIVNDDDDDVICLSDDYIDIRLCAESVSQDQDKVGGNSSTKNFALGNCKIDKANEEMNGANFDKVNATNENEDSGRRTQKKSNPKLCYEEVPAAVAWPVEMDFLLQPQILRPFRVRTPPSDASNTDSEIDEPDSPSEVLSLCGDWLKNKNRLACNVWLEDENKGEDDHCHSPLGSVENRSKELKNEYLTLDSLKNKDRVYDGVCKSQGGTGKVLDGNNRSNLDIADEVFKDNLMFTTRDLQRNNTHELPDLLGHQENINKIYLHRNEGNINSRSSQRFDISVKSTSLNTGGGRVNSKDLHMIEENTRVGCSNIDAEVQEVSPISKRISIEHAFEEQQKDKARVLRRTREQNKLLATPCKPSDTKDNTLEEEISPIFSSTYKKPVRTNIPLYSSTPKVNAKRLFKVDTPPVSHLSISSIRESSCDMNILCNEDLIGDKVKEGTEEKDTEDENNIINDKSKVKSIGDLRNDDTCVLHISKDKTVIEKSSKDKGAEIEKADVKGEVKILPPLLNQRSKIQSKLSAFTFTKHKLKDSNALSTDVSEFKADRNANSKRNIDGSFDLFSDSDDKNARKFSPRLSSEAKSVTNKKDMPVRDAGSSSLMQVPIQDDDQKCHMYKQMQDLTEETDHAGRHKSKVMRVEASQLIKPKLGGNETNQTGIRELNKATKEDQIIATKSNIIEANQVLKTKLTGAEGSHALKPKHDEMELSLVKTSKTNVHQGTVHSDTSIHTSTINFDLMLDDDLFANINEADFDNEMNREVLHNNNKGSTEVLEMNTMKNEAKEKLLKMNKVNKGGHKDVKDTFNEGNELNHVNSKLPKEVHHHSEANKSFPNKEKSCVNQSDPTLLGITQIMDLVNGNSPQKETNLFDEPVFDTSKNVDKISTITKACRKSLSTVDGHPLATENATKLSSINLKEIDESKFSSSTPKRNSIFKWKRKEQEPSQQMSQNPHHQVSHHASDETSHKKTHQLSQNTSCQTSQNPCVDFNLLGDDELEQMSESLLADIEGNFRMGKECSKINTKHFHGEKSRSDHTREGGSVLSPISSSGSLLQGHGQGVHLGGGSLTPSDKISKNPFQRINSSEYTEEQNSCTSPQTPKLIKFQSPNQKMRSKANKLTKVLDASERSILYPTQDESHVWQRRKRKCGQVVESDDEYSILNSASNVTKTSLNTSSSDNSLCFGNKLRNRNYAIGVSAVEDDDDGDFVEYSEVVCLNQKQKKENNNVDKRDQSIKKVRKQKTTKAFLETEAEVSHDGDEVSSDETDCEGELDSSFVDDCTQLSQDPAVDMKAVYLQSVANRDEVGYQRFRPPPRLPDIHDTDESYGTLDMSDDSFVVDNSHVEYDTEYVGDSMLAEDPIIHQAILNKATTKEKNSLTGGKGARKRILIQSSSSDDDDELEGDKKRSSNVVSSPYTEYPRNASQNTPMVEHNISANYNSEKKPTKKAPIVINTSPDQYSKPPYTSNLTPKVPLAIIRPQQKETIESSTVSPSVTCMPSTISVSKLQSKPSTSLLTTAVTSSKSVPHSSYTPEGNGRPDTFQASQETFSLSQPNTSTKTMTQHCPPVVLVDPGELGHSGRIVTGLRLQHGAHTAVLSVSPAHYVISTRMAVVRLSFSVFSSQQQRGHLVTTLQSLLEMYDRPVVLVETDREMGSVPHSSPSSKRSRYLDTLTCAFVQVSHVKLLYSSDQEETMSVLAQLMEQERTKGYSIPVLPQDINKLKQVINFYRSLPQISIATALTFAHNFTTIADFIKSSTEDMKQKCNISQQRAEAIKQHLTCHFRKDMLPP
ncbi:hypothetical protein Pmani_023272 [Petrolisthes manimaculis]|uniref:Fanconi anemia group M protein n=1 Tax=Petrolisthes manimaculis TaxID=1843537 RepID=A0AAE1PCK8_9EUCA|nr:hypothetical protein Pmani_023272 [Petrolisthes manimaculis]